MREELNEQVNSGDISPQNAFRDEFGVQYSQESEEQLEVDREPDVAIERGNHPVVNLFFSFDIVNSTLYKSTTANWPVILIALLDTIRYMVQNAMCKDCALWRVIGDEMVFVCPISSVDQLVESVDEVFEILQRITTCLSDGSFFETIEGQRIDDFQINHLKSQNILSVQATAWIAIERVKPDSPYLFSQPRGFVDHPRIPWFCCNCHAESNILILIWL